MEERLATIEQVENVYPIEGKDKIGLATLKDLGWSVIVQKDEIKVGDLVIYCKIDSVLPELPEFEFLRKKCFVDNGIVRGFRIRTMKMAGVISSGLVLPLSILGADILEVGQDVTKKLNVTHYQSKDDIEGEEDAQRKYIVANRGWWFRIKNLLHLRTSKQWPSFIVHTDEPRIQNLKVLLEDTGDWYKSEKENGQSASYAKYHGKYWVCSRTQVKKIVGGNLFEKFLTWADNKILGTKFEGNNNWTKISDKFHLENIPDGYVVQGEIIGNGIQGNNYHLNELDFYVYNIKNIDINEDLSLAAMLAFCKEFNLKFVPILNDNLKLVGKSLEDILQDADGESKLYPTLREGVVYRKHTGNGQKVSFKAISNKYLLKNEK